MRKILLLGLIVLASCSEDPQGLKHQVDFFCNGQTTLFRTWLGAYEKMPADLREQRFMLDEAIRAASIYDNVLFCVSCRASMQKEMDQLGEDYSQLSHDIRMIHTRFYDSLPQVQFDTLKTLMQKAKSILDRINEEPIKN